MRFFDKHDFCNIEEHNYYEDFKKGLRRHAENYYDDQYAIMKKRFIRRIMECKKNGAAWRECADVLIVTVEDGKDAN